MVWHEINNSMTAVNLTLDFLHKHGGAISTRQLRQELSFSLQSLDHIKNVLRMASSTDEINRGQRQTKFYLDELVMISVRIISRKWQNAELQFVNNSPNLELYGNKTAMMEVLMNLITNALESYQNQDLEGKLPVKITLKKTAEDQQVSISIQDWGCGIPPEAAAKIFEKYFSLKTEHGGTGIGLALCQQIIEGQFEGELSFTSREGTGSTFQVLIPL